MHKTKTEIHQLKQKYGDEQVLVVRPELFSDVPTGFTAVDEDEKVIYCKHDNDGKFVMRYDAEGNPAFLQLIPYVVIKSSNGEYFAYERLSGSGEARLHSQLSLGFGGHINPCDGPSLYIFKGMVRELEEELIYHNVKPLEYIGMVRDLNSNLTDHIGFVFELEVDAAEVKEKDKYKGMWLTKEQLKEKYFLFEGWSKHIVDHIYEN